MIRILLLDDHRVVRSGYRRLLDAEVGLQVVAEAETVDEAYAHVCAGGIDVAIVDLSLRGASGIEAIRRMRARMRTLRILVLSMHDQAGYVTQAVRAGALGYLTKSCDPDELVSAVHTVFTGRRAIAPEVAQTLAHVALDGEQALDCLTPREFEVLRLAARGRSVTDIAAHMHLSPKTVFNHLSTIRHKLDADNDFKLFRLALSHGLVDADDDALACAVAG